jgi:4-aminobutyrate aminotransferase-like enzyme
MIGVELVPECAEQGPQVVAGMFGAGFIIDFHPASSTFRLFPPFVISPREVDSFLHSFERVLVGRCADPMI